MSVYYAIIVWIAFFALLSIVIPMQQKETVMGQQTIRFNIGWAIVAVIPLLYYTTVRKNVGDTGNYMAMYEQLPESYSEIASYMTTQTKDRGFYFFACLIKATFGSNVQIFFFIVALIQILILVLIYRKYSTHYVMSIFLFLASTDYVSWLFNGIRQFMAVTITFALFSLILKKKYVPAIILILFASLFHQTALLMIPFIFIVQGKAWNKKTLLFIVAVVVIVAYVGQFTDILDNMLQETQYENVVSDWKEWGDNGTSALRVLVYAVPTILSLIGIRYINDANDSVINMCVNMSIISTGLYLVSMVTSGIFIGRLPIYFSLYNYILLPWEIDHMFTKRSATFMKGALIVAYLAFYYVGMRGLGLI